MLWPKYHATQVNANLADTGMPCVGIDGNPFMINWLAFERDIPSDAISSRPSNLPAPKLICFSNLYDALKAHMNPNINLATQTLQAFTTHIIRVYFP